MFISYDDNTAPPLNNYTMGTSTAPRAPPPFVQLLEEIYFSLSFTEPFLLLFFFDFHSVAHRDGKVYCSAGLFVFLFCFVLFLFLFLFLLIITRSGLLARIKYRLCVSFSRVDSNRLICLVSRVFANGLGELDSIPGRVMPKT